jgi:hypothetical protein
VISALVWFATFATIGWLATVLPRAVGMAWFAFYAYMAYGTLSCGRVGSAVVLLIEGLLMAWLLFGIARLNSASPTCTRQP